MLQEKVEGFTGSRRVQATLVNGKAVFGMDKGCNSGPMVHPMRGSGKTIELMEMVNSSI